MTLLPWQTLHETRCLRLDPFGRLRTVRLPDGRVVPDHYTARVGDYALVYGVTEEGKVLMLRQYKHGPRRVCLTFPGGYVGLVHRAQCFDAGA